MLLGNPWHADVSDALTRTGPAGLWLIAVATVLLVASCGLAEDGRPKGETSKPPSVADVAGLLSRAERPHPRLFTGEQTFPALRAKAAGDPTLTALRDRLLAEADGMLALPPEQRRLTGRRLLGVSRTVLRRTLTLSLAYQMTGDRKYAARAETEMLAAAGFEDWNPSHFLDVAEMTAALAVGYDWLHDAMPEATRTTIRKAIVDKGLQPSLDKPGWWVQTTTNWNQVCHAGLTMGAIAVAEDHPDLAATIIARAVANVPRAMDVYGPNGAYPEGPMYWNYGTSFNVLLIEALRTGLGTDFGLGEHERFRASGEYYLHAHGPTGRYFNYSDCGERGGVGPSPFWFARALERPELLWMEKRKLASMLKRRPNPKGASYRLLPLLLVWAPPLKDVPAPKTLSYSDTGETPVAMLRTGWEPDAVFVGLKGGTPSANHAHMDIGSFVLAADGVRWAIDLGSQSYHSLESKGVKLWSGKQDGQRWQVFRLSPLSHNTLTVDGKLQRVKGKGEIEHVLKAKPRLLDGQDEDWQSAIVDMSSVYAGQLASARRTVSLTPRRQVLVDDTLRGGEADVEVRWAMVTRAKIELDGSAATLRQDGKTMRVEVLEPANVKLEIASTDPPADYDADNPGTRMLVFRVKVPAGKDASLRVRFQPGSVDATPAPATASRFTHW